MLYVHRIPECWLYIIGAYRYNVIDLPWEPSVNLHTLLGELGKPTSTENTHEESNTALTRRFCTFFSFGSSLEEALFRNGYDNETTLNSTLKYLQKVESQFQMFFFIKKELYFWIWTDLGTFSVKYCTSETIQNPLLDKILNKFFNKFLNKILNNYYT